LGNNGTKTIGLLKRLAATGLRDPVRARDRLNFKFSQAAKVFCVQCCEHIYYLRDSTAEHSADRFAPSDKYHVRNDWSCPACGARYFCAFSGGVPVIKTDRGYL